MASGRHKQPFAREHSLRKLDNAGQLNIKKLADAGFYFHFDSVTNAQYIKCYACNCVLKDIRPEEVENIWSIHAQSVHYPDCTHVLNRKGLDYMQENQDGQWGEMKGYNSETVRTRCWKEKPQPRVVSKIDEITYRTLQRHSMEKGSLPTGVNYAVERYPEMAYENKRLEMMNDSMYEQHAKAGFFRENIGDLGCSIRLRCFSCNALWIAPDREDPWEKHVFLQHACPYLLLRKGTDFVRETYRRNCRRQRLLSK
ncbi:E3 ubiquitin-protein ligase XIAP-like isoform X2 [Mya arenaria]|uniref:E3 ubiquitin-protein ligase XIAP-like isoform X2 n=1 Tax=Mya arenaria TaxID=6604 RepID=UPI0022DFE871|nr:E3 ubiquitin-protein ligase XIAP-like isoform X2 [Mya arenaria]XP_052811694.1 E3 ubiquitin-protein ligase XIAP-like isoform X2 [Mya arenaria]